MTSVVVLFRISKRREISSIYPRTWTPHIFPKSENGNQPSDRRIQLTIRPHCRLSRSVRRQRSSPTFQTACKDSATGNYQCYRCPKQEEQGGCQASPEDLGRMPQSQLFCMIHACGPKEGNACLTPQNSKIQKQSEDPILFQ